MKTSPFSRALVCFAAAACLAFSASASLRLPTLFADHMVLQESPATALWGWADPGTTITVTLGEQSATATATPKGRWQTSLDLTRSGAGPHQLAITDGTNSVLLQDVLIGEVWLVSGQSNMLFRLGRTIDGRQEAARAALPRIRQFEVGHTPAPSAQEEGSGRWLLCQPPDAAIFSGIAYYFAKELERELDRPIGIINASVGGTMAEAWMSLDAFAADPDLQRGAERNNTEFLSLPERQQRYATELQSWLTRSQRADSSPQATERYTAQSTTQTSARSDEPTWSAVKVPGPILSQPGIVWLRRDVTLNAEQTNRPLELRLERPRGFETIYWNGHAIGGTDWQAYPGTNAPRIYSVPAQYLKEGSNTLAIRLYSPLETVAIAGRDKDFLAGGTNISGQWSYATERSFVPLSKAESTSAPQAFPYRAPQTQVASLFNGMIQPLTSCTLAGILWYQGESNAQRAWQYRITLPLLIQDWRKHWGREDIPFYFCQLPKFRPQPAQSPEGSWAELRESQNLATTLPHTAQAVLIDLGEETDIHPRNKRDPGLRFAAIALRHTYGKERATSGPVFQQARLQGNAVELTFTHATGGLVAGDLPKTYQPSSLLPETKPLPRNRPESQLEGFAVCGKDGVWVWADARISGANTVVVHSPEVPQPVAVRYAWSDFPVCNLFNAAGLPAAPFRTDDQPLITRETRFGL